MGLAASKQEAFWEACGFGHINRVKRFLEDKEIDVNWVSYTHDSCAIHVASQGKIEIVKMLLKANCNVNVQDANGSLPLHHAAMKGHADIMELLLKGGSYLDFQDKNNWTPLTKAAYFCQPAAVDVLLKKNCDVHLKNSDGRAALHEACRSQSKDEVGLGKIAQGLIQAGSDLNSKSLDVGEADFTPLMFCGYHGHPRIAEALIAAGCDLNAQGSNGWSALHWAADRGNLETAQILLDAGVDPLLEGRRGELCVDRALKNEMKELLGKAVDEAQQKAGIPSPSQVEAKLKALNEAISAKSAQNKALAAMVNPRPIPAVANLQEEEEWDRRSPVSTMDGSESERSLPGTPEMVHKEKSEVEPLEKDEAVKETAATADSTSHKTPEDKKLNKVRFTDLESNKKSSSNAESAPKAEAEDLFSDDALDSPVKSKSTSSARQSSSNKHSAPKNKASVGVQVQLMKPKPNADPTEVKPRTNEEVDDFEDVIDEKEFADDLYDHDD